MQELSEEIINFLQRQGVVIISTLDSQGRIHCSAKGIVSIEKEGKIYVIDLYCGKTFNNLSQNPTTSITAIDERRFVGYTLQGKARIVEKKDFDTALIKTWEEKVVARISKRLIKNVQEGKGSVRHPEAHLPPVQHLIALEVESIVDLTPAHIKEKAL